MSLPDFESGHKDPVFGGVFGSRTKDAPWRRRPGWRVTQRRTLIDLAGEAHSLAMV